MGGKWLELLKEIAPAISRVAVILMPGHVTKAGLFWAVEGFAPSLGGQLTPAAVREAAEGGGAIDEFSRGSKGRPMGVRSPHCLPPSRANHRFGRPIPLAGTLPIPFFLSDRRLDVLRHQSARPVPASGRLR